ncbi:MAG TPA: endolytic transglycosylase MltG, partial [Anaerolineae bacterium]|nr:endolytic transglycosylase MltG [Anaerolineae bacterium]
MTENQKPRSRLGFLFILIPLIAIVCAVAAYAYSIPIAAERLGSPSTTLDPLDRLYLATHLLVNERRLYELAGDPGLNLDFEILEGESAVEVVERLAAVGLVYDGELLLNYLEYRGLDVGVKAGTHELSGFMTVVELAEKLQSAISSEVPFTIVAGWRMEQIADTLPTSGLSIDPEAFLAAAHARPVGYSFASEIPSPPSLEGFLFPDAYTLDREITVVDLVVTMLDNFEAKVGADLHEGFEQQGLSLYQGVTLASILEREAVVDDEMPIMASVFLNRIALDMKLDADPTIQ